MFTVLYTYGSKHTFAYESIVYQSKVATSRVANQRKQTTTPRFENVHDFEKIDIDCRL